MLQFIDSTIEYRMNIYYFMLSNGMGRMNVKGGMN